MVSDQNRLWKKESFCYNIAPHIPENEEHSYEIFVNEKYYPVSHKKHSRTLVLELVSSYIQVGIRSQ